MGGQRPDRPWDFMPLRFGKGIIYICGAILVALILFGVLREAKMAHHLRFRQILAAVGLASMGPHSAIAASAAEESGMAVPPTVIGINLSPPQPYRMSRAFANLALGGRWQLASRVKMEVDPASLDPNGYLKRLPDGISVYRILAQPAFRSGASIRCTFQGQGAVRLVGPGTRNAHAGTNSVSFDWVNGGSYANSVAILRISALGPGNWIHDLDCRETDMPRAARFEPHFIAFVRQFKVVRFMDWQSTNHNRKISWNTRHTPNSIEIGDDDGVSIEDMVDLVTETGTDAWFNMPWNADDDYVRRFAQYVHDHLPTDRHVYVEAGNEVWNARFPMSKQALAEGQSEGLSADPETARLYRYAERLTHVMDIWGKVFADRPHQLVRVANCQNGPNRSNLVLAYKDTYRHIDALATAPYFTDNFRKNPPRGTDDVFAALDVALDKTLDAALLTKAVAYKYGKRYIAYEAGQAVALPDIELARKVQRDPRMYDAYRRFLKAWREKIGDTIMMYDSVQPIAKVGSFGLLEYLGQPLAAAPKMRAVSEEIHQMRH